MGRRFRQLRRIANQTVHVLRRTTRFCACCGRLVELTRRVVVLLTSVMKRTGPRRDQAVSPSPVPKGLCCSCQCRSHARRHNSNPEESTCRGASLQEAIATDTDASSQPIQARSSLSQDSHQNNLQFAESVTPCSCHDYREVSGNSDQDYIERSSCSVKDHELRANSYQDPTARSSSSIKDLSDQDQIGRSSSSIKDIDNDHEHNVNSDQDRIRQSFCRIRDQGNDHELSVNSGQDHIAQSSSVNRNLDSDHELSVNSGQDHIAQSSSVNRNLDSDHELSVNSGQDHIAQSSSVNRNLDSDHELSVNSGQDHIAQSSSVNRNLDSDHELSVNSDQDHIAQSSSVNRNLDSDHELSVNSDQDHIAQSSSVNRNLDSDHELSVNSDQDHIAQSSSVNRNLDSDHELSVNSDQDHIAQSSSVNRNLDSDHELSVNSDQDHIAQSSSRIRDLGNDHEIRVISDQDRIGRSSSDIKDHKLSVNSDQDQSTSSIKHFGNDHKLSLNSDQDLIEQSSSRVKNPGKGHQLGVNSDQAHTGQFFSSIRNLGNDHEGRSNSNGEHESDSSSTYDHEADFKSKNDHKGGHEGGFNSTYDLQDGSYASSQNLSQAFSIQSHENSESTLKPVENSDEITQLLRTQSNDVNLQEIKIMTRLSSEFSGVSAEGRNTESEASSEELYISIDILNAEMSSEEYYGHLDRDASEATERKGSAPSVQLNTEIYGSSRIPTTSSSSPTESFTAPVADEPAAITVVEVPVLENITASQGMILDTTAATPSSVLYTPAVTLLTIPDTPPMNPVLTRNITAAASAPATNTTADTLVSSSSTPAVISKLNRHAITENSVSTPGICSRAQISSVDTSVSKSASQATAAGTPVRTPDTTVIHSVSSSTSTTDFHAQTLHSAMVTPVSSAAMPGERVVSTTAAVPAPDIAVEVSTSCRDNEDDTAVGDVEIQTSVTPMPVDATEVVTEEAHSEGAIRATTEAPAVDVVEILSLAMGTITLDNTAAPPKATLAPNSTAGINTLCTTATGNTTPSTTESASHYARTPSVPIRVIPSADSAPSCATAAIPDPSLKTSTVVQDLEQDHHKAIHVHSLHSNSTIPESRKERGNEKENVVKGGNEKENVVKGVNETESGISHPLPSASHISQKALTLGNFEANGAPSCGSHLKLERIKTTVTKDSGCSEQNNASPSHSRVIKHALPQSENKRLKHTDKESQGNAPCDKKTPDKPMNTSSSCLQGLAQSSDKSSPTKDKVVRGKRGSRPWRSYLGKSCFPNCSYCAIEASSRKRLEKYFRTNPVPESPDSETILEMARRHVIYMQRVANMKAKEHRKRVNIPFPLSQTPCPPVTAPPDFRVEYAINDEWHHIYPIEWSIQQNITTHGTGVVDLAMLGEYNKQIAVKTMPVEESKREYQLIKECQGPFVVQLCASLIQGDTRYLCMTYYRRRDLARWLKRDDNRKYFGRVESTWICAYILAAIEFLHDNDILHLDIKPSNILIHNRGFPVLGDFGSARRVEELQGPRETFPFTLAYASPEVLAGVQPTHMADLWPLACIFYELLTSRTPFYRTDNIDVQLKQTLEAKPSLTELPSRARDFVRSQLRTQITERLGYNSGVREVMHHPIFEKLNWVEVKYAHRHCDCRLLAVFEQIERDEREAKNRSGPTLSNPFRYRNRHFMYSTKHHNPRNNYVRYIF